MVTDPTHTALSIVAVVVPCLLFLIFVGPKVTPHSREQWAILMATLFVLWMPMGWYLIFIAGTSKNANPQQVVRAGALNLLIGVPLFIVIGRRILKINK
jgi:hypothetical protein